MTLTDLIRPEIRALTAYHVPASDGLIKLDAMENPYPLPEILKDAWLERLRNAPLNRYPDPVARDLTGRLHAALDVPDGMRLMLGNGSDELIQILLTACAQEGAVAMAPVPTFVMYEFLARVAGVRFQGVPLNADFTLDRARLLAAIAGHRPALIFLACPNNPTGVLYTREDVSAILEAAPGFVVVDEAYYPFAGETWLGELPRHENLLVMRTLSKQGLAGLRLGLLAGRPEHLSEFDKIRLPYNINVLTQISAGFALENPGAFDEQAALIRIEREALTAALADVPGVEVFPSRANFLLFRTGALAHTVFERLKARGVLIKCLEGAHPMLKGCLRVTVGTGEENRLFLGALAAVV